MAPDAASSQVDVLVRDDKGATILVVEIKRHKAVDDPLARALVGLSFM